jgi:uncharacterized protein DUF6788
MNTKSSISSWLEKTKVLWPVAKGSLNQVRKRCSRPGCRICASGERHPAWLFTYRQDGRLHSLHVPRPMVAAVRRAIANGRRLEAAMVAAGVSLIRERPRR